MGSVRVTHPSARPQSPDEQGSQLQPFDVEDQIEEPGEDDERHTEVHGASQAGGSCTTPNGGKPRAHGSVRRVEFKGLAAKVPFRLSSPPVSPYNEEQVKREEEMRKRRLMQQNSLPNLTKLGTSAKALHLINEQAKKQIEKETAIATNQVQPVEETTIIPLTGLVKFPMDQTSLPVKLDATGQHTLSWDRTVRRTDTGKVVLPAGTLNIYHFPMIKPSLDASSDDVRQKSLE